MKCVSYDVSFSPERPHELKKVRPTLLELCQAFRSHFPDFWFLLCGEHYQPTDQPGVAPRQSHTFTGLLVFDRDLPVTDEVISLQVWLHGPSS